VVQVHLLRQGDPRISKDHAQDDRRGQGKEQAPGAGKKHLGACRPRNRDNRIRSVNDVIKTYLNRYELDHRGQEKSIAFAKGRLAQVGRLIGTTLLPDLTEDAVRDYIAKRIAAGISGRTVNMEVGELSRAIGKPWSVLWPKVKKQQENTDVGQALSPGQEKRLLATAAKKNGGSWRRP